ncbi:salt stress protein, Slr1339 family [Laspinema olomoucense]|uniref:ATPase n=1 Tax=Laspinema olomoucense D3b TaxID=2953688 RepID=A0ABT2N6N6_9CYAN|nr:MULTISPECIES: hypothetical protein [unclassified Laspinema]MCT7978358.1 hypothetical protein [Laspinema sp. D3b]MCT7990520.1 hypothetical protein [Laspinema sp. D3a]MCT7993059.1 hypothetical protein [Laspinema sp. D3c]
MDSIEKLLGEIKAETQNSGPKFPEQMEANRTHKAANSLSANPPQLMYNLDSLLEKVESEAKEHKVQPFVNVQPIELEVTSKGLGGHLDQLFGDLKQEFEAQEQAEQLKREQERQEEAKKLERLKQKQREELAKRAQEWLKKLDPYSDEGFWFGQFAEHYSSKLEAAIAYLEATPSEKRGEG